MSGCLLCKNHEHKVWARENGHVLLKCSSCGLLYLERMPEGQEREEALQLGLHKGESIVDTNKKPDPSRVGHYLETLKAFYPDPEIMHGKKWLDAGAGNGEFIAALRIYFPGIICTAVEPNKQKRNSPLYGDVMVHSTLSGIPGQFDKISLLNVWSHLPDPISFTAQLTGLLKDKGELIIQTGNAAEIDRYEFPGKLLLPDHVSFASPMLVERIMEKQRLRLVQLIRYRYPRKLHIRYIIRLAAKFILGRQPYPYGYVAGRFRDCWMRFRKS